MSERLACKIMFGEVRGSEIIELMERTTGKPCPCKQGGTCPLQALGPASGLSGARQ